MNHTGPSPTPVAPDSHGQQHSISVYLKVWGLLLVLSTLSYLVNYLHVESLIHQVLIVVSMITKAGLIVSVFTYMMWERLALVYAILTSSLTLLILMVSTAAEAHYTFGMYALLFHWAPFSAPLNNDRRTQYLREIRHQIGPILNADRHAHKRIGNTH